MPKRPTPKPTTHTRFTALREVVRRIRSAVDSYLRRRSHRSFQLSRRRDYIRPLKLPKYWRFTGLVWMMLWRHKALFGLLAALYAVIYALMVGVISQDTYQQLSSTINTVGPQVIQGNLGGFSQGVALYVTALSNNINGQLDASKQAYAGLLGLLLWLTVVWLLRAIMAGKAPRLRDGLYNSGAPILSTFMVSLVLIVQALPVAIAAIAYGAASATGLLGGGIETMLFWVVVSLLVALSLYWMTSTFIALIIVTLPGMHPMQALRAAGDLVLGRRLKVLWRVVWLLLLIAVVWTAVVLPMIFFDGWIKSVWPAIQWLPLIPGLLLAMGSLSLIYTGAYIYTLYRRIVEDDTSTDAN